MKECAEESLKAIFYSIFFLYTCTPAATLEAIRERISNEDLGGISVEFTRGSSHGTPKGISQWNF